MVISVEIISTIFQKQKEYNNQSTQEKTVVNSQIVTILKKLCCQSFHKVLFGELKQTNRQDNHILEQQVIM